MNDFLKIMSELIKQILEGPRAIREEDTRRLQVCYSEMSVSERKKALEALFPGDLETYVYLLSFVLSYINDEQVKNAIEDALEDDKFPVMSGVIFANQMNKRLFVNKMEYDEYDEHKRKQQIHEKNVEKVKRMLLQKFEYIPYAERQTKRVVLIIEPILGENHAPTKKMVNISSFFQQLGYEVLVVANSYRKMEEIRCLQWWEMYMDNSLFQDTGCFNIDILGVSVSGCHIAYADEHYIDDVLLGLEVIREFNPEFVLMIGERSILADLCNEFTTSVTMACVNRPPVTTSQIVARYFNCTEEQEAFYKKCLGSKKILDFKHVNILERPVTTSLTREQFGIREEDFVIIVAGNRLNFEIKDEARQLLCNVLDENPEAIIAFVGKADSLETELGQTKYAKCFRYLGFQPNFEDAVGLGDIFLNPPRQGGGTGGSRAMLKGVPVITLPNCDVASVGDAFICDTLADMPKLVKRYMTDADFMKHQKEQCRVSVERIFGVDSIANLKKMCEELECEIKKCEVSK